MRRKDNSVNVVMRFGKDILQSDGMRREKSFMQHGNISTYMHSFTVAVMCVKIAKFLSIGVNTRSLVRGALLHDYFLYDWHDPDKSHKWHGFHHAKRAMNNASRDFELNKIERNMIGAHMFPLNLPVPRYRESVILCIADKLCAIKETFSGRSPGTKK